MTPDALAVGISGQAAAWPEALPSPSQGPDADIMAFLQAMIDAHASADAEGLALATPATAENGDTTDVTGKSPVRTVVAPSSVAADRVDRHAERLGALVRHLSASLDEMVSEVPVVDARFVDALVAEVTVAPAATPPQIDTRTSIVESPDEHEDDDALAAMFLVSAALPIPPPAPQTPSPVESLSVEPGRELATVEGDRTTTIDIVPLASSMSGTPVSVDTVSAEELVSGLSTDAQTLIDAVQDIELESSPEVLAQHDAAVPERSGDDARLASVDTSHPSVVETPRPAHSASRALEFFRALRHASPDPINTVEPAVSLADVNHASTPAGAEAPAVTSTPAQKAAASSTEPAAARGRTTSMAAQSAVDTFSPRTALAPVGDAADEPASHSGHQQSGSREYQGLFYNERTPFLQQARLAPSLLVAPATIELPPAVIAARAPEFQGAPLPNEAAVAATLVRSMHWQYKNGVGSAVVNLDPGYLGEVSVALQVKGDAVTATVHAANPEVRAWMQANEGVLRDSLAAQGLSLDALVVAEDEPSERSSSDSRRRDDAEQEPPPRKRQPRRDESMTFEVIV